ncbi:hypothetical protein AB0L88_03150 [Saccharopolyspora shandongensis]|uniref:hypothetical protein n=1 Tax=Saccharopolyspora shandongensis TaxID=418495 RepID=UPI00342FB345
MTETLAQQQAAGLRALADMVEAHPEIPATYLGGFFGIDVWFPQSAEEMAAIARAALKHGAKVEKDISETQYNLTIAWGPFKARALGNRGKVCERVVTGTETVTRKVPDPSVVVPMVEVTEEVETFEWRCAPLLAADAEAVSA